MTEPRLPVAAKTDASPRHQGTSAKYMFCQNLQTVFYLTIDVIVTKCMFIISTKCINYCDPTILIIWFNLTGSFGRRISKEYKMKIKQEYFLYALKLCLCSFGQNPRTHPGPELEPVMSLPFFTAPCDLPPSQSITTIAAATVLHASHGDSLSSVCLPFIRTLMANHSPDAQPWLSHKESISFPGRCYYNSKIRFAFMAASHLESPCDVVISLCSWCSW